MPDKRIENRIAKANRDHRAAAAVDLAERRAKSREVLTSLLAKSYDARINALLPGSKTVSQLVDKDRLKLLNSVRTREISTRMIAADFATSYELLRSRLRFKVWPLVLCGLFVVAGGAIATAAYKRTPEAMVIVVGTQWWDVERVRSDGAVSTDTIKPSEHVVYGLVRTEGNYGVLRDWVPGRGYDEFKLPLSTLDYAR